MSNISIVKAQMIDFWVIRPYRIMSLFRSFGGMCCSIFKMTEIRLGRPSSDWEGKVCRLYTKLARIVTNQSYGKGRQNKHIGTNLLSSTHQTVTSATPGVKIWHLTSLRPLATDNDIVHTDYKTRHGH